MPFSEEQLLLSLSSVISALSFAIGVVVFVRDPRRSINRLFFALALLGSVWILAVVAILLLKEVSVELVLGRIGLFTSTIIGILIYTFSLNFPENIGNKLKIPPRSYLLIAALTAVLCLTPYVFSDVEIGPRGESINTYGLAYYLFSLVFLYSIVAALVVLFRKRGTLSASLQKQNTLVLAGVSASAFLAFLSNGLLPILLDSSRPERYGPITILFFIGFTGYAIIRHQLFQIKVIATEFFIILLWILLTIRLLLTNTPSDRLYEGLVFLFGSSLGVLLIRSVRSEVARREEVQRANLSLEALSDITRRITQSLDFTEVTQELVDLVAKRLGYVGALVLLLDEDHRSIHPTAVSNTKEIKRALKMLSVPLTALVGDITEGNLISQVISMGKVVDGHSLEQFLSPALDPQVAKSFTATLDIKSILAVPIVSEGKVLGALLFGLRKERKEITFKERETMKALGDELGIITRNIRIIEELRRLDSAKTEFISIASHQLRTPISATKGYISMILEGDFGRVSAAVKDPLSKVYQANDRLVALIDDLLDISRIEGGRMKYTMGETDLLPLIADTIELVKPQGDKKGLQIITDIPKKIPPVWADAEKLRELLKNITDNSFKYTAQGSVSIAITINKQKGTLLYSVKDTGMGITPQDLSKLFQKFSRGSSVSVVHTEGTGLGLYVARKIAEAHHARVWAESAGQGKGAQFYFEIPYMTESGKPPKLSLSEITNS